MKPIINFLPSSEPQNSAQVHQTEVLEASASNSDPRCDVESLNVRQMKCSTYIDGQKVREASAVNAKDAKDIAVASALENLKQQCSALVIKSDAVGQSENQSDLNLTVKTRVRPLQQQGEKLTESNNIGGKLMKKMGWTGGGLGKNAQGIVEPILATTTGTRAGLGLTSASTGRDFQLGGKLTKKIGWAGGGLGKNAQGIVEPILAATTVTRAGLGAFDTGRDFQLAEENLSSNIGGKLTKKMGLEGGGIRKNANGMVEPILAVPSKRGQLGAFDTGRDFQLAVEHLIREWMQSETMEDLRFSPNFNHIARREIHNLASRLGANSQSNGKGKKRHLVISRYSGQGVASAGQYLRANEPTNNLLPSSESQNSIQTHQAQFSVPSEPNVIPKRLYDLPGPFGKYVLLHMPGVKQSVHSLMNRIAADNNAAYHSIFEPLNSGETKCTVYIDGQKVCEACHLSPVIAKDDAVWTGLEILRQQCYTLVIKSDAVGQSVSQSDLNLTVKTRVRPPQQQGEKLTESNNVGAKLMKMMGWTGGGLGKNAQGILEPIVATTTVKRGGLGLTSASTRRYGGIEKDAQGILEPIPATSTVKRGELGLTSASTSRDGGLEKDAQDVLEPIPATSTINPGELWLTSTRRDFTNAVRKLIHEWIQSRAQKDLQFSCEFTKRDRDLIHTIARRMGAKATKFGWESGKCLVLSRKQSLKDIVEELLEGCGNTEKYALLEPGTPLPD